MASHVAIDPEDAIVRLRHDLHRHPEVSEAEYETARRIREFFAPLQPDETVEALGGHGLAFGFGNRRSGPTVMLRCELDALPIRETNGFAHRSTRDGFSHACGHDGHMAILAAVGRRLADTRPSAGRVVLLFQPAEETGTGARAVLDDERFDALRPDLVFATHNLPGFALGDVVIRDGTFACASRGMTIELEGRTAHAAQPETGRSPALAMASLVDSLTRLRIAPGEGEPRIASFVTVVGARLGERSFGIVPDRAVVWATLRSPTDAGMSRLVQQAESLANDAANGASLDLRIDYDEVFAATSNDPAAAAIVRRAAGDRTVVEPDEPFRWSEDFGRFTAASPGALFGIGSGTDVPALHHSDYDFPDALLAPTADLFLAILRESGIRLG